MKTNLQLIKYIDHKILRSQLFCLSIQVAEPGIDFLLIQYLGSHSTHSCFQYPGVMAEPSLVVNCLSYIANTGLNNRFVTPIVYFDSVPGVSESSSASLTSRLLNSRRSLRKATRSREMPDSIMVQRTPSISPTRCFALFIAISYAYVFHVSYFLPCALHPAPLSRQSLSEGGQHPAPSTQHSYPKAHILYHLKDYACKACCCNTGNTDSKGKFCQKVTFEFLNGCFIFVYEHCLDNKQVII